MKNKLDYSKWQRWSWRSESRYYLLSVTQNLFGEWIAIKKWGGRYTHIHGSKSEYLGNIEEIAKIFAITHKKRITRGYSQLFESS